ncbi:hypothetical protein QTL86_19235 [Cellulosilyticum sp. ST5]|uniref:hypothetical protein n=1 Tax=unclassified Cellulosilyticum TaxID=2643091 RepID=UPI000F8DEF4C|nr:hypothetical protein [Cellulosilyticum sp. WCF-2]QEH67282.1 hypothetical protein EKH84_02055 [Cellulosilyticum sp. WCF-2]
MTTVWTKEMDDFIKKYYTRIGPIAVANRLSITTEEASKRAAWLGATMRKDSKELSDFDIYQMKYRKLKSKLKVGDTLSVATERLVKDRVLKVPEKKKIIGMYSSYIVLDNGRYRETITYIELVEQLKIS